MMLKSEIIHLMCEPQNLPENEAESWHFHNSDYINFPILSWQDQAK